VDRLLVAAVMPRWVLSGLRGVIIVIVIQWDSVGRRPSGRPGTGLDSSRLNWPG
jgi:hypothetical protein